MKTNLKQKKANDLMLAKYPYEAFLIHKEQRHMDAIVEHIAAEIHLKLSDKNKAQ